MQSIVNTRFYVLSALIIGALWSACDEVPVPVPNNPSDPPDSVDRPDPGEMPAGTFFNPLLESGADPWVYFKDGFYYVMVSPGATFGSNEPEDRIFTIRKTAEMSELRSAPVTEVWTAPADGPNSTNLWAPELYFLDGKWYIYFAASAGGLDQRSFVLENASADPTTGEWVEKGAIIGDRYAIDGSILEHPNGKRYFMWAGHTQTDGQTSRIFISEMSNPWTLTGPQVEIAAPVYDWEKIGDPLPDINEAPEALVRNGKVFIVYSASGCWTDDYALGLLTADETSDPLDPASWTKSPAPVFSKNPEGGAYGPGHNGFFKSVDGTEDWLIYHANENSGGGCDDSRTPRMQEFTWNADGTPNFGTPVAVNTPVEVPSGE